MTSVYGCLTPSWPSCRDKRLGPKCQACFVATSTQASVSDQQVSDVLLGIALSVEDEFRCVNPNCVPKPFDPGAACDKSVYDVLVPQQFQGCITTAPPTTEVVSAQKSHKERHDQGKGAKTLAFKSKWKANRPWLELRTVAQDDHEHKRGASNVGQRMQCCHHHRHRFVILHFLILFLSYPGFLLPFSSFLHHGNLQKLQTRP